MDLSRDVLYTVNRRPLCGQARAIAATNKLRVVVFPFEERRVEVLEASDESKERSKVKLTCCRFVIQTRLEVLEASEESEERSKFKLTCCRFVIQTRLEAPSAREDQTRKIKQE